MSLINLAFWFLLRRVLGLVTFVGILLVLLFNFFVWAFLRMIIASFLFGEEYREDASPKEKMKFRVAVLEERKKFASTWAGTICNPVYRWGGMLLLWPTLYLFVQYIRAKLQAYPFTDEISPWRFSLPFICEEKAVAPIFLRECERAFPDFLLRRGEYSYRDDDEFFNKFHLKWKSTSTPHQGGGTPSPMRAQAM